MQKSLKNSYYILIASLMMLGLETELYAKSIQPTEKAGTSLWCYAFIIASAIFLIFSLIQFRCLKREKKYRKEITKFNDAFVRSKRDSSKIIDDKYETHDIKKLAAYTSQIIETRNEALKSLNMNQELLVYHSILIENVNDAIISTDLSLRIRSWNGAATKIFGYKNGDVIGKNLQELLGLKFISTTQSVAFEIVNNNGNWDGELLYTPRSGEVIYLFGSITLIKKSRSSQGMVCIFSNITKRKKAQKAYLESEKLFRSMFNNANIGNCIFDSNFKFEKVNKYLLNLLEYSSSELREKKLNEIIETKDWEQIKSNVEKLILEQNKSIRFEVRFVTKSLNNFWAEVSMKSIIVDSSHEPQLICSIVDIDNRKRNEQALRESGEKFKNILNNIKDGFFRVDEEFNIVLVSPSLAEMIGDKEIDDLIGIKLHEIFNSELEIRKMSQELKVKGVLNNYRIAINENDSERVFTVNAAKWKEEANKRSGYDGLIRDTTIEFRAQQALKESEEKYRTLVEAAQIGITIISEDEILFANKAFLQMMNYKSTQDVDSLLIKRLNDPILSKKDTRSYDFYVERTEDRVHHEQDVKRTDGKIVSMSITSSVIKVNGKDCIQSTYVNNTKRKKAIEALRTSELKYRTLATNSSDVIWTMKTNRTVTYISPSIKNLLGYSSDEVNAIDIIKNIGDEFVEKIQSDYNRFNEENNNLNSRKISYRTVKKIVKKNNSQVWLEVSINPLFDENKCLTGIIGNARDVTDRKEAEIQLNTQVRYLKSISECQQLLMRDDLSFEEGIEHTLTIVRELFDTCRTYLYENYEDDNLGVYSIRKFLVQSKRCDAKLHGSINRKIVFNNGFQRWKNTFMRGKPVKGIISDFSKEEQILLNAQKTISTILIPLIIDGTWVGLIGFDETHFERHWTKDEIHLMQTVGDIIVSYIERKRARADLEIERERLIKQMDMKTLDLSTANAELSRAARLKDEFLANMSHELRTPLNAILGMSEAMQEQIYGPLNDKELKTLKTIEESGQHLLDLINDILDLSKIGVGKLTLDRAEISVDSVCNTCLRMIKQSASQKSIQVVFNSNCQDETVYADERRLKQILVNLLTNAIKFTDEEKKIGFEVFCEKGTNTISFSVWDEGPGIREYELNDLFKPFVQLDSSLTRRHEGTGLGLSMVEKLTKMHCGSISLESVPGSGSRFTVSIPKKQVVKKASDRSYQKAKTEKNIKTSALFIDEKSNSVQSIINHLSEGNIKSELHSQGEGAIEKAVVFKPDVILLDIFLPDMLGWNVLKELKQNKHTQNTPVIIISMLDEASKGIELGAECYLLKPVTKQQLLLSINQAIPNKENVKALLIMADQLSSIKSMNKVLIVDENENIINTLMDNLLSRNYRVMVARNGMEAIKRAKEDKPNLIIIEHRLPVMDGYQAIMKIREISELIDTPIIATSSLILPGDKSKLLSVGADVFLPKPVDMDGLNRNIKSLKAMHIVNKM